ncbi:MAG: DUF1080 domain-containing protein [Spirosomataceae bacterium]
MNKLLTIGLAAFCATSSFAQTPTLTKKEEKQGWKLLFDGKTFAGWHKYNGKEVGSAWMVHDGAMMLMGKDMRNGATAGDIITDEEFENYELSLEWKVAKNANSGIMFNVKEDSKYGAPYYTGPEMQVLDNDGHPDGKIKTHRSGDLYDMISCSTETVKPVGEWNQVRLVVNKGKSEFYLNGTKVVEFEMFNEQWKEMIAKSKFKAWKDFGTFKIGRICLQDHGDEVWYRNIKIRKL